MPMMELGVRILLVGPDGGGMAPPPERSMGDGVDEVPSLCATSVDWWRECVAAASAALVMEARRELGPEAPPLA